MTVAIIAVTITAIIMIGMFIFYTDYLYPGAPNPPSDDPKDIQYNLRVIIADEDVIPHSSNFFWVGISLNSELTFDDNTTLGPYIEDFEIWQDDVEGRQFDGLSNMQYSFNLLEQMLENGNEMRICISDPTDPWELVVWNIGNEEWSTTSTFGDGPLAGEDTTGAYWLSHPAVIGTESYMVYFELIP